MKLKTVILFALCFFLMTTVSFANSDHVATLEKIKGEVLVIRSTGETDQAEEGMKLYQGDSVRTGEHSLAKVNFGDGDAVTLEQNTKVTIVQLHSNSDEKKVTVKQESGITWTEVEKLPDFNKQFKVETEKAEIEVHGTLFLTEIASNGNTKVAVTDGYVSVDSPYYENEVLVNPSEQHYVSENSSQTDPINFVEIFNQLQPEFVVEMVAMVIEIVDIQVRNAEEMVEIASQNPNEEIMQETVTVLAEAKMNLEMLQQMINALNETTNREAVVAVQNMLWNIERLNEYVNDLSEYVKAMDQQVEEIIEAQAPSDDDDDDVDVDDNDDESGTDPSSSAPTKKGKGYNFYTSDGEIILRLEWNPPSNNINLFYWIYENNQSERKCSPCENNKPYLEKFYSNLIEISLPIYFNIIAVEYDADNDDYIQSQPLEIVVDEIGDILPYPNESNEEEVLGVESELDPNEPSEENPSEGDENSNTPSEENTTEDDAGLDQNNPNEEDTLSEGDGDSNTPSEENTTEDDVGLDSNDPNEENPSEGDGDSNTPDEEDTFEGNAELE